MQIDNRDRLGALVSCALGQGFAIVQVKVRDTSATLRAAMEGCGGTVGEQLALEVDRVKLGGTGSDVKYCG